MPKLNDAIAIYFNGEAAERAYLGGTLVWEAPTAPVNTSPPVVTGAVNSGDTASTTSGTWTGGSILEHDYKWQINDGGFEDVVGESTSTYASIPAGEFRSGVRVRNAAGWSEWAYSAPFVVTEASTGLVWIGAARATLAGALATSNFTGSIYERAVAWSEALPDNCYVEFSTTVDDASYPLGGAGLWDKDSPDDPGAWADVGQFFSEESFGALIDGPDTIFCLHNGDDYKAPGDVDETLYPVVRFGLARSGNNVWMRQVWVGGNGGWIGGGNPATSTAPTATMNSSGSLRITATPPVNGAAQIYAPGEHLAAAPAGFTAA